MEADPIENETKSSLISHFPIIPLHLLRDKINKNGVSTEKSLHSPRGRVEVCKGGCTKTTPRPKHKWQSSGKYFSLGWFSANQVWYLTNLVTNNVCSKNGTWGWLKSYITIWQYSPNAEHAIERTICFQEICTIKLTWKESVYEQF